MKNGYDKLYDKVLKLDSRIRFTGVLDSKGDLVIEKNRDDTKLLNPDEVKMSIHYTFERWTLFKIYLINLEKKNHQLQNMRK